LLGEAALDAALSRPRQMASYRDAPTVFDLAAAYAFAIVWLANGMS
jgi:prophage maintenance system killer protein